MKSIFIAFDQAHRDKIVDMLERSNCRGFTAWEQVTGRGSVDGEPHYGSPPWPREGTINTYSVDVKNV